MFKACGKASVIQTLGTYLCIFLWQAWAAEPPRHWLLYVYYFQQLWCYAYFSKKKKKWAEYSYFRWLINDMFTFSPSPKCKNYRINTFLKNPLQCQKQRRGATYKSKQGEISGNEETNEKKADRDNRVSILLCSLTLFFLPQEQLQTQSLLLQKQK